MPAHTNREGMTFSEWLMATNPFGGPAPIEGATARRAWRAGEDPSEYASKVRRTHRTHGRAHLRHTFGGLPIGGRFYLKSSKRADLLKKVDNQHAAYPDGFKLTIRANTLVEYEGNRASGSVRENDTPTARKLKALHDGELWKAFSAMQILEHEIDKIPADELRAPIPGFRDKRWILEKIRSIRADIDTLRKGVSARVWREA